MTLSFSRRCACMLASLVLLFGCSTSTPATRYYLLTDPAQMNALADSSCRAGFTGTRLAPYLQRSHIMLQSGTNELVPAIQHRWSEPLDAGISRLLSSCLGGDANASQSASVVIEHLHGSTDGQVVLQAQWVLRGGAEGTGGTRSGRFSRTLEQPSAGYDSLVTTQRELVLGLCEDIRAALPSC